MARLISLGLSPAPRRRDAAAPGGRIDAAGVVASTPRRGRVAAAWVPLWVRVQPEKKRRVPGINCRSARSRRARLNIYPSRRVSIFLTNSAAHVRAVGWTRSSRYMPRWTGGRPRCDRDHRAGVDATGPLGDATYTPAAATRPLRGVDATTPAASTRPVAPTRPPAVSTPPPRGVGSDQASGGAATSVHHRSARVHFASTPLATAHS